MNMEYQNWHKYLIFALIVTGMIYFLPKTNLKRIEIVYLAALILVVYLALLAMNQNAMKNDKPIETYSNVNSGSIHGDGITYSFLGDDISKGNPYTWSNKRLFPGGASAWKAQPNNEPLLKDPLFVPQGHPVPPKDYYTKPIPPGESMFVFANNQCKPECCVNFAPTFSCDRGCVCTTPQQRKYIGEQRGGNKTYIGSYPYL